MATDESDRNGDWLVVVGRSLAFLCLSAADLRDKDLGTQGRFLETLGVPRKDAAALLGTTRASLNEMMSRTARKGGAKRGRTKTG